MGGRFGLYAETSSGRIWLHNQYLCNIPRVVRPAVSPHAGLFYAGHPLFYLPHIQICDDIQNTFCNQCSSMQGSAKQNQRRVTSNRVDISGLHFE